jgi:hypothetical protein
MPHWKTDLLHRRCRSHRRRCPHRFRWSRRCSLSRWCPHCRSGLAGSFPPTTKSDRLMRRRSHCHRRSSFASSTSSWTPLTPLLLGDRWHTCSCCRWKPSSWTPLPPLLLDYKECHGNEESSDLYGVTDVHSKKARTTVQ